MGQTILTPHQHHFLECASANPGITKRFYLTGGTALAAFYYQHRLSEDIDLFCETEEVNQGVVEVFIKKISPRLGVTRYDTKVFLGLVSYILLFADGGQLKVDFNYYPFPRIAKGKTHWSLEVDSVRDIAVNKVHTLFMKPRVRDYVDLFFIMTREAYDLTTLIGEAKAKFDWHIDLPTLGSQLMRVTDIAQRELPTMLVPFDRQEMEEFFLRLAASLKSEILTE